MFKDMGKDAAKELKEAVQTSKLLTNGKLETRIVFGKERKIPNFIDLSKSEAERQGKNMKFDLSFVSLTADVKYKNQPTNVVLKQEPLENSERTNNFLKLYFLDEKESLESKKLAELAEKKRQQEAEKKRQQEDIFGNIGKEISKNIDDTVKNINKTSNDVGKIVTDVFKGFKF